MKNVFRNYRCRRALSLLLCFVMIFAAACAGNDASAAAKPAFQKSKLSLAVGKSAQLKVKKLPKGAKVVSTVWKAQKPGVVKVTVSGSGAKKKKALTAKAKGLKAGKSTVSCTVTYKVKKSGKWSQKKNKITASVTVTGNPKTTTVPASAAPGNSAAPSHTENPVSPTGRPSDVTSMPDVTENPPVIEETPEPGPTVAPTPAPTVPADVHQNFSKTAMEFSKNLKIGWNVGNSLDAVKDDGAYQTGNAGLASETAWGNPKITENLIKAVKTAGFNTIRVPVTWTNHTDPDTYQIDETWMDRVEEVVRYCTDNELYVILNVHHDGGEGGNSWLTPIPSDETKMKERYRKVWEQIAARFKDYSNLVMFSSMNEYHYGYDAPKKAYCTLQNELHQIFVDTVRKSGGNNGQRYLVIPGYNTHVDHTISELKLPTDSVEDHLMVEVHYYDPYTFGTDGNETDQWGSDFGGATAADSWGQEKYLISQLKKLKTAFTDKGVPVVIGEFGAPAKKDPANEKYRTYYLQYVVKYAVEYGLVPVYWDNGSAYRLFDRNTCAVVYPDIVNGMMAALTPGYEIPLPK